MCQVPCIATATKLKNKYRYTSDGGNSTRLQCTTYLSETCQENKQDQQTIKSRPNIT